MTAASNEKGSSARIRSGAPSTFFKHPCQIWTVRSHARSRKIRLSFEIAIKIPTTSAFLRKAVLAKLGHHGAPESPLMVRGASRREGSVTADQWRRRAR